MAKKDIDDLITRSLDEFGFIEAIYPSESWNESLMARLQSNRRRGSSRVSSVVLGTLGVFILSINVFYSAKVINRSLHPAYTNADRLGIIADELLINLIEEKN